jgi:prolyl-tRNA synthetase
VTEAARALTDELTAAGVRVRLDDRVATAFGRRATDWELKGVPVRIEVGPRDLAEGRAVLARRDTGDKEPVDLSALAARVPSLLEQVQADLLAGATAERDARTVDVTSVDEAREAAATGFARIAWSALGEDGVQALGRDAITVRCLQTADGGVPETPDVPDLVALVARSY